MSPCHGCGFSAYDGSGRKFLTKTNVYSVSQTATGPKCPGGTAHGIGSVNTTDVYRYDPVTCAYSCTASGTFLWDVTVTGNGAPPAGEIHCSGTRTICGQSTTRSKSWNCSGVLSTDDSFTYPDQAVGAEYYPVNMCINPTGDPVITYTATVYTITFDLGTMVATLTDECIPP